MTGGPGLRRAGRIPLVALALAVALPFALLARLGLRRAAMEGWCRLGARALGLRVRHRGPGAPSGCLVASNHVGYLDILILGSTVPGSFLAKAEIDEWAFLGTLTRWSGAIFVQRDRPRSAVPFLREIARRFRAGDRVLLFPEAGVSCDGRTLGSFRPMLFQACVESGRPVLPVAIRYLAPPDPRVWAWVEEPNLWRHLWNRLLPAERIEVEARFGEPLWPTPGEGRKELAARAREAVEQLLGSDDRPPGTAQAPKREGET